MLSIRPLLWNLLCGLICLACIAGAWGIESATPHESPRIVLAEGERVDSIVLKDRSGESAALFSSTNRQRRILYVISPFCSWCRRNEANIRALVRCIPASVDFVTVSIGSEGLEQYLGPVPPPYRVLIDEHGSTNVSGTPVTVLINEDGIIDKVWHGAYGGATQRQVAETFGCALPGLL